MNLGCDIFDLEINDVANGNWSVQVLSSPVGDKTEVFTVAATLGRAQILELARSALQQQTIAKAFNESADAESTSEELGRKLFEGVFVEDVLQCFRESKRASEQKQRSLRIQLRSSPALSLVPWELLYDPDEHDFVALDKNTSLVRYVEQRGAKKSLRVDSQLQILAMAPTPTGLPTLNVEREKERVARVLAPLEEMGLVQLEWVDWQTYERLEDELEENPKKWHMFHFIGHGDFGAESDAGYLCFEDELGEPNPVGARDVARVFKGTSVVLAVLNACDGGGESSHDAFAGVAHAVAGSGVPAVIAMRSAISDVAAQVFSQSLYTSFAKGLTVESAVTHARRAIRRRDDRSLAWTTPVLYMRAEGDGVLFDIPQLLALTPDERLVEESLDTAPEEGVFEEWASWEDCDPEQGREALARLALDVPGVFAGSTFVGGRSTRLSFYESHVLLELQPEGGGDERAYVLHGPEHSLWLDGGSGPIHDTNDKESLVLTAATVVDYLRFFMFFLRGDEGAFLLVEESDSSMPSGWSVVAEPNDLASGARSVHRLGVPLMPRGVQDDGRWRFEGTVSYGRSVYFSVLAVAPDGEVEMLDDEPIMAAAEVPSLALTTFGSGAADEDEDQEEKDAPWIAPPRVVVDAEHVWITSGDEGSLTCWERGEGDGAFVGTLPVGGNPAAVARDTNAVWVASCDTGLVHRVDPTTRMIVKSIEVLNPFSLAIGAAGVWVASYDDDVVRRIDPSTNAVSGALAVGRNVTSMKVAGHAVWVANRSANTVYCIDPITEDVIPIDVPNPWALSVDADAVWVVDDENDLVYCIDRSTHAIVKDIPVGKSPGEITASPRAIWVINDNDNTIQCIDPDTYAPGDPIALEEGWHGIAAWGDAGVVVATETETNISWKTYH